MRFTIFLLLFAFGFATCKTHVKSLTESMGQEIIEIGTPIKELPPGLEEEPAAEFDEDEKSTSTSVQPATKREVRKTTTVPPTTTLQTTAEVTEDALSPDEEETRIEKELSEIYKDTDYKSEPTKEVVKKPVVTVDDMPDKPIARARTNFKFQPDVNDRADVERFRTSVDEISCDKRVTQQLNNEIVVLQQGMELAYKKEGPVATSAGRFLADCMETSLVFVSVLFYL